MRRSGPDIHLFVTRAHDGRSVAATKPNSWDRQLDALDDLRDTTMDPMRASQYQASGVEPSQPGRGRTPVEVQL